MQGNLVSRTVFGPVISADGKYSVSAQVRYYNSQDSLQETFQIIVRDAQSGAIIKDYIHVKSAIDGQVLRGVGSFGFKEGSSTVIKLTYLDGPTEYYEVAAPYAITKHSPDGKYRVIQSGSTLIASDVNGELGRFVSGGFAGSFAVTNNGVYFYGGRDNIFMRFVSWNNFRTQDYQHLRDVYSEITVKFHVSFIPGNVFFNIDPSNPAIADIRAMTSSGVNLRLDLDRMWEVEIAKADIAYGPITSGDGKYVVTGKVEYNSTQHPLQQRFKVVVRDGESGGKLKEIFVKDATDGQVLRGIRSFGFKDNSSAVVKITYSAGATEYYDAATGDQTKYSPDGKHKVVHSNGIFIASDANGEVGRFNNPTASFAVTNEGLYLSGSDQGVNPYIWFKSWDNIKDKEARNPTRNVFNEIVQKFHFTPVLADLNIDPANSAIADVFQGGTSKIYRINFDTMELISQSGAEGEAALLARVDEVFSENQPSSLGPVSVSSNLLGLLAWDQTETNNKKKRSEVRFIVPLTEELSEVALADYLSQYGVTVRSVKAVMEASEKIASIELPRNVVEALLDSVAPETAPGYENPVRVKAMRAAREAMGDYAWMLNAKEPVHLAAPVNAKKLNAQDLGALSILFNQGDQLKFVVPGMTAAQAKGMMDAAAKEALKLGNANFSQTITLNSSGPSTQEIANILRRVASGNLFTSAHSAVLDSQRDVLDAVGATRSARLLSPSNVDEQIVVVITAALLRQQMPETYTVQDLEKWLSENKIDIHAVAARVSEMLKVLRTIAIAA